MITASEYLKLREKHISSVREDISAKIDDFISHKLVERGICVSYTLRSGLDIHCLNFNDIISDEFKKRGFEFIQQPENLNWFQLSIKE